MHKTQIDEVDLRFGPAAVKRRVSDALETTDVAIVYYELDPGDSFAFGYHAHDDQEEVFYIQSGTVTFETEDGDITVSAGEAIRFAPGEFQRGVNTSDERVIGLGIGAPLETREIDIYRECESCGDRTLQGIEMTDERDALLTRCLECETVTGRFVYGEATPN